MGKLEDVTDSGLLPCPSCENPAEYWVGTDLQADAIYCSECPLGVEYAGMSYDALAIIWNGLPRYTKITELEDMLFARGAMISAPCFCCGYNGEGYFNPDKHACAKRHYIKIGEA